MITIKCCFSFVYFYLLSLIFSQNIWITILYKYTGCLKIHEFRIQRVVGKDPVELEKYLEKKIAFPEEDTGCLKMIVFGVRGLVGDIFF
jgi:hypothetical protein